MILVLSESHSSVPCHSSRVYKQSSVEEVFMLMLLTVCIGEFFSSPAMGLVDSVVLGSLGQLRLNCIGAIFREKCPKVHPKVAKYFGD